MPAMAITDHGTMFGVIEFFQGRQSAGSNPSSGWKAICLRAG